MPRTLGELRETLLTRAEILEAEIEGESPARLQSEISEESDLARVVALCSLLDWSIKRSGPRTLMVESQ